ncbi:MAG: hypothetical protein JW888_11050 [Pirellulales bacterium]|nr:hypothetical protein [Pirellulales bacterium]
MTENTSKVDPVLLMAPVAERAQIQDFRVLKASMKRSEEVVFPLHVENQFRTSSRTDRESSTVVGVVVLTLLASRVKESSETDGQGVCDSDPVIEINIEYQLTYEVSGITAFKDEQLNAFGCVNGLYNSWPYWREYVQSSIARMGLPPFVVPVLTVAELQKMEKAADGTFSMNAAAEPE